MFGTEVCHTLKEASMNCHYTYTPALATKHYTTNHKKVKQHNISEGATAYRRNNKAKSREVQIRQESGVPRERWPRLANADQPPNLTCHLELIPHRKLLPTPGITSQTRLKRQHGPSKAKHNKKSVPKNKLSLTTKY